MENREFTANLQGILSPVEITLLERLPRQLVKEISLAVHYGADLGSAIGNMSVASTVGVISEGTRQALFLCSRFGHEYRQKLGFQAVLQSCLDNGGFPDGLP